MDGNTQGILDLLLNKSALKQDVSEDTQAVFRMFKEEVRKELKELKKNVEDERIRLNMVERSDYEFHVYVGSDVLVFQMHTNVFKLPDENPMWKTNYLKEDTSHGYFGIIHIYNFLAESFIQNRMNDAGYLIGRMFVNHDKHFLVEGKGQLGFLFRDLEKGVINENVVRHIIQCSFAYALEFDLLTPPYEMIHQVSVGQMQALGNSLQLTTGKRLGFKFQAEDGDFF